MMNRQKSSAGREMFRVLGWRRLVFLLILIALAVNGQVYSQDAKGTFKISGQSSAQCVMYGKVLEHLLDYLGYDASFVVVEGNAAFPLMETGDIDCYGGGIWLPAQQPAWDKYVKERKTVKPITIMTDDCLYQFAVPKYVADAGVRSMNDLQRFASRFDKKLYTVPAGTGGWKIVQNTITNNIYGLSGWEQVAVNFLPLVTEMVEKYKRREWFTFTAWSPDWMNNVMELVYLDDPEATWGGASQIWNAGTANLATRAPNAYRLMEQYRISHAIANEWIYNMGFEKKDPDEIARNWIKQNLPIVDIWLMGVTDKSGKKSGSAAVREALSR